MSTIIVEENWDGATPPSIPSGWTANTAWLKTQAASPRSGSVTLAFPAELVGPFPSGASAAYTPPTGIDGDMRVSSWFRLEGGGTPRQTAGVMVRKGGPVTSGFDAVVTGCYQFTISRGGGGNEVAVYRQFESGRVQLTRLVPSSLDADAYYQVQGTATGVDVTALAMRVRRDSDGLWLDPSGAWVADAVDCLVATDAAPLGLANYRYGGLIFLPEAGAGTIRTDDFQFEAGIVPAPASAPALAASARPASASFSASPDGSSGGPTPDPAPRPALAAAARAASAALGAATADNPPVASALAASARPASVRLGAAATPGAPGIAALAAVAGPASASFSASASDGPVDVPGGGHGTGPADEPPNDDLPGAVEARYLATPDLVALAPRVYNSQAAGDATMPYVVFKIGGGSVAFESADSYWVDQRIKFECFASHAAPANAIMRAVTASFGGDRGTDGVVLSYADGITTPLVMSGRPQAAEKARGRDNARVFRSTVEYSARARLGRPS